MNTPSLIIQKLLENVGKQNYAKASLYMVATPIGNLGDISLRALHVLGMVDVIACEDTRHTQHLLHSYGIQKPLVALHLHNEMEAAQALLNTLAEGKSAAYVSDAGTPAISDPGAKLVAQVQAAGYKVVPIPGASSVITLLSACGAASENAAFSFAGFAPSKGAERKEWLKNIEKNTDAVVFFETPHRIKELAGDVATFEDRKISIGRELTKQYEEIVTLPCKAMLGWLEQSPQHSKGEFCLALHSSQEKTVNNQEGENILKRLLEEGVGLKTAVKLAAEFSGQSKNALYDKALELKDGQSKS